jgi:hypothetical protein
MGNDHVLPKINKSRQKLAKRLRHARGEKRPSAAKQGAPTSQEDWLRKLNSPTPFDVIRAWRDAEPIELEALPKLDGWGVAFFVMMILQFFGGAYASTRVKPYQLPRVTPGQKPGDGSRDLSGAFGTHHNFSVNDVHEFFATSRGGKGSSFDSGDEIQSENRAIEGQGRFKRSGDGQHSGQSTGHHVHHHHTKPDPERDSDGDHTHDSHRRNDAENIANPLQDSVVYPEDKLSSWMKNVFNSLESIGVMLGPALRAIGFEPDELIEVKPSISGTEHIPMASRNVTAAEFCMHLSTEGYEKFRLNPVTERGNELKRIIEEKGRHGENNFLTKEVLNPIKQKHMEEGAKAIGNKFRDIDDIFLDHAATLYHVKGRTPVKVHMSASYAASIRGELGNIVKISGANGAAARYFAIVPHHPDLVIQVPDPNSNEKWRSWMASTGKHLFFSDPSIFRGSSTFSVEEQDISGERSFGVLRSSGVLRGAVRHTLEPIVDGTMKHMTTLMGHDTPADDVLKRILGFIPFYDFAKSATGGQYKKAMVFLGFDLIPYMGKGAKILFKTVLKSTPARLAADQVAKWSDRGFNLLSKSGSGNIADGVVDDLKQREERDRQRQHAKGR